MYCVQMYCVQMYCVQIDCVQINCTQPLIFDFRRLLCFYPIKFVLKTHGKGLALILNT